MLDLRVYRAAFAPAVLAAVITAFSLGSPPRAATTTLAPDAFQGSRAFGSLRDLVAGYPDRRPGGRGDQSLAREVAAQMRSNGLQVSSERFSGQTIDGERTLTNVVGVRPGSLTSRRIVVIAHRDAAARGSDAQLSGTAALLELARVYSGRALRRTLVLVSTSGGSGGDAGAREFARHPGGPVDAVIVLGDLAGTTLRGPQVVPWSNAEGIASIELQRTVQAALHDETGLHERGPSSLGQWTRLAVPLTVGEQGEVVPQQLPAVLLSASGERGPGAERAVTEFRLSSFGRAALRAITALDARHGAALDVRVAVLSGPNVLPSWSVWLLVGALLLPVLVTAVDAFARASRRRGPMGAWVAWAATSALPFLLAAGVALSLGVTGLLPAAPHAPVGNGAAEFGAAGWACLLVVVLAAVAAVPLRRYLLGALALRADGGPVGDSEGAGAAVLLLVAAVALGIWIANPFAAALLTPAAHIAVFVAAPEVRLRRGVALGLVAVAALPGLLVLAYYTRQFGLALDQVPATALQVVAGGHFGIAGLLGWSYVLGALSCLVVVAASQRPLKEEPPVVVTRGPRTYAGPGSLGGTESALRR
jgi:Peptidase family M28